MTLRQERLSFGSSAPQYIKLFEDCFPETLGTSLCTEEHYRWKFGMAGKAIPAFEFGAFNGDELIGYYGTLPFQFRADSRFVVGGLVCDVMTHSSVRGQGIFTKQGKYATAALADAGVMFLTGFPIRESVIPGHIKVGWRIAFDLPVYFKLIDPLLPLTERGWEWLGHALRPACDVYRRLVRPARDASVSCQHEHLDACFRSEAYAELYSRWARAYPFHLARTPDFYSWRLGAPETRYSIITLRRNGHLGGIAITRRTCLQGLEIVSIVDLILLPEFRNVVGHLHEEISRVAEDSGAAGVVVMSPLPQARHLRLGRNGYFRSPVKFKLILKWLGSDNPPPSFWKAESWHLAWADTDNL